MFEARHQGKSGHWGMWRAGVLWGLPPFLICISWVMWARMIQVASGAEYPPYAVSWTPRPWDAFTEEQKEALKEHHWRYDAVRSAFPHPLEED